ncbi:NAD-dependent epimerase/dehydratase family protein [Streptomyces sp. NBC_00328]|uniref:NAD-dependent epimerase/dehydratase family protein n=1 Tax=Streptomyces sp. NBC_00328 TaxID=2903646 RepID=UPI002E28BDC6|nr:NAD-dependent epimerase/dehydratase family protein [Streptomyces sp. NBC_00328]
MTVLAAGVSTTHATAEGEFERELDLVRETARRCHRTGRTVVLFSTASSAMYGTTEAPASEDTVALSASRYGRHKRRVEEVVGESGAHWLVLRPSHLMGAGQRAHQLLPSLVGQIRSGRVRVHRGAHRDLLDVMDLVAVLDGLLTADVRDEIVNVASGTPCAAEDIVRGIERRLGRTAVHETADGVRQRTLVSVDKLRKLLPEASVAERLGGEGHLDRLLDRYVSCY